MPSGLFASQITSSASRWFWQARPQVQYARHSRSPFLSGRASGGGRWRSRCYPVTKDECGSAKYISTPSVARTRSLPHGLHPPSRPRCGKWLATGRDKNDSFVWGTSRRNPPLRFTSSEDGRVELPTSGTILRPLTSAGRFKVGSQTLMGPRVSTFFLSYPFCRNTDTSIRPA